MNKTRQKREEDKMQIHLNNKKKDEILHHMFQYRYSVLRDGGEILSFLLLLLLSIRAFRL